MPILFDSLVNLGTRWATPTGQTHQIPIFRGLRRRLGTVVVGWTNSPNEELKSKILRMKNSRWYRGLLKLVLKAKVNRPPGGRGRDGTCLSPEGSCRLRYLDLVSRRRRVLPRVRRHGGRPGSTFRMKGQGHSQATTNAKAEVKPFCLGVMVLDLKH